MTGIPTGSRSIPTPPDIGQSPQSLPPSLRQIIAKKGSHQKSVETRQQESAVILDEQIFLRLPKVKALTGLSKSTLYELIQRKNFPPSILLGRRTVGWLKSEVDQWISERIRASRQGRTIRWPR